MGRLHELVWELLVSDRRPTGRSGGPAAPGHRPAEA